MPSVSVRIKIVDGVLALRELHLLQRDRVVIKLRLYTERGAASGTDFRATTHMPAEQEKRFQRGEGGRTLRPHPR